MTDRASFFSYIRKNLFGGTITQLQVEGITTILDVWDKGWAACELRWLAYMLATAHHETGRTMQPIEEYGKGANHPYGQRWKESGQHYSDTECLFYGRGYVQLTWYENYLKAGKILNQDFLHHPELVMTPHNASEIMFHGMTEGWFTGRKLGQYFGSGIGDWVNARRIINGLDKADLVADYGKKYYSALLVEEPAATMPDFSDVVARAESTAPAGKS